MYINVQFIQNIHNYTVIHTQSLSHIRQIKYLIRAFLNLKCLCYGRMKTACLSTYHTSTLVFKHIQGLHSNYSLENHGRCSRHNICQSHKKITFTFALSNTTGKLVTSNNSQHCIYTKRCNKTS